MSTTVLVAGATGRFGSIIEMLVERGHRVRALTRTPNSPTGLELSRRGADLVRGDFDDPGSLERAMDGVDAVFATGTMHRAGPDGERRHGKNIVDAARAAHVGHLVYVSGAGAGHGTGVPVFEVKGEVEDYIRQLGVAHTTVAPVYLMENLFNPWNMAALRARKLPTYLPTDRKLQQVPVVDVLRFAVVVLEHRDRFVGQHVEIAADELTAAEMVQTVSRVSGRRHVVEAADPGTLGPGLSTLFEWLGRKGHDVDIETLHRRYPEVGWHSFEQWASSVVDLRAA